MSVISASWPTSMRAKRRRQNGSSITPAASHRIGEVHEGAATMDWMEQERERGITITSASTTVYWKGVPKSTSSTPRATSTSPLKWSVLCAFSMALLPFSMPLPACSLNPKQSGAKRTSTAFRGSRSSTRWTASAPTIFMAVKSMKEKLGANAVAVHCPIGARVEFKGMVDLVTMKAYHLPRRDDGC